LQQKWLASLDAQVHFMGFMSESFQLAVHCSYALQVPRVSSRLRKLPFAALCMLLLWAAMHCRVSQQAGGIGSNMSATTSSSSSSSSAAMQVPSAYIAGLSSKTTGTLSSMTVAAVPILLALFVVQVRGQTAKLSIHHRVPFCCDCSLDSVATTNLASFVPRHGILYNSRAAC
jgi:hypothetical protein